MKNKILVVDDDLLNLKSTALCLEEWGYEVTTAESGQSALQLLESKDNSFAVILMDFRMPDLNGAETSAQIRQFNEESVIIMYSGDSSRDATLEAFKKGGVLDYVDKGGDLDHLKVVVDNACKKYEESTKLLKLYVPNTESEKLLSSIGLIGKSPAMTRIGPKINLYRDDERPVLILGETGTGKEQIARALHAGSADKFFVVNCASFTNSSLLESELCGYERGAFTGANVRKIGLLEMAHEGTIFFDELHRLEQDGQAKLLRILQEKKIRRVGGASEISVKFRPIAATHPNLEEMVRQEKFLQDLYYRLNHLTIEVPALRNRMEDIGPLVSHFVEKFNQKNGTKKQFLVSTIRTMEKHSWPGNVRELDAVVYKTLKDTPGSTIKPEHLDPRLFDVTKTFSNYEEFKNQQICEQKKFLVNTLNNKKSVAHAAEYLGLPASTLKSMLERLNVKYGRQNH
ncbi:MAG: sigma-54-dependent Fis family transcriptional regulator [Oligoflexia bacterium]|nr:sigma-54-dependent Fis family transcriptional regulator [Oligoflexia bacterium]